jgi:hypothetical protein
MHCKQRLAIFPSPSLFLQCVTGVHDIFKGKNPAQMLVKQLWGWERVLVGIVRF